MRTTLLAALTLAAPLAHAQPDFVFVNARVYTVDDRFTVAQAFAVEDGMFATIGSNEDVRATIGISTKVIDLGGRTVLPGLIDAHGHMAGLGQLQLGVIDLAGTTSYDEVIERVVERAEQAEPGEWIIGRGWDHESWPEKELPSHERLSEAVPDNPVWLSRVDGHAGLANARAMVLIAVTDSSMDMRTLRWLYVGEADTVTVSSSTPAARASSAPRPFGTSAVRVTPSGVPTAAITRSLPAMAGTALGLTKAPTSRWVTPAASRASTRATRSSTGIGSSPWRPSRAPTSRRVTVSGPRAALTWP
ncbi:MAG: amidohydrolase family protein, partial [Myxococcales bacterium]|nr:amidohydrolase family protein [Myxococcales bacterium]